MFESNPFIEYNSDVTNILIPILESVEKIKPRLKGSRTIIFRRIPVLLILPKLKISICRLSIWYCIESIVLKDKRNWRGKIVAQCREVDLGYITSIIVLCYGARFRSRQNQVNLGNSTALDLIECVKGTCQEWKIP